MSPIFCAMTLCILVEDGMPVVFTQKRLGKNLSVFNIYKFRTMKLGTPQSGTHNINDNHILNTGKVIRKFKLDEFPQLINVVKGELNLIGPRPGLENQIKLKDYRMQRSIFNITPGITGLAQVTGFDMSDPEKLAKVDEFYINNYSVKIDCEIFFATFLKFMRKRLIRRLYEI